MMSLTFGLFTQVSGSGPLGPLVEKKMFAQGSSADLLYKNIQTICPVCPHSLKFDKHFLNMNLRKLF